MSTTTQGPSFPSRRPLGRARQALLCLAALVSAACHDAVVAPIPDTPATTAAVTPRATGQLAAPGGRALRSVDARADLLSDVSSLWDYGPSTGRFGGCWVNQTASQNFAEQFVLAEASVIQQVKVFTCNFPLHSSVHVKILADNGGLPGGYVYESDVSDAILAPSGTESITEVSATLPTPFVAAAGVRYWIGVSGNGFELSQASLNPGPGDSHMAQFTARNYAFSAGVGDMAFQLFGRPANEPPQLILRDASGIEGSPTALSLSATDPNDDALAYTWDFGDGASGHGDALPTSHTYADNRSYTLTVTADDGKGGTDSRTATVTIVNAAPVVSAGPDATIISGESYDFRGTFSDAGVDDSPWSWQLAWGDGTSIGDQTTSQSGAITRSRQFLRAGTYAVQLTVTDKDLAPGVGGLTLTVSRLRVGVSTFPFLSTLPALPVVYDPTYPVRSTPTVVALLGSSSFAVADAVTRAPLVNVSSLLLGHTPVASLLGHPLVAAVDVNRDGVLDLVLTFATDRLVASGDLSGAIRTPQTLVLTGDHSDGRQFTGSTTVSVVLKPAPRADR